MPAPWTRCGLASPGFAAGEVLVHAVSKRAAETGWIAPDQTRPLRHRVRLERFGRVVGLTADAIPSLRRTHIAAGDPYRIVQRHAAGHALGLQPFVYRADGPDEA
jgi:hypothetical protein